MAEPLRNTLDPSAEREKLNQSHIPANPDAPEPANPDAPEPANPNAPKPANPDAPKP